MANILKNLKMTDSGSSKSNSGYNTSSPLIKSYTTTTTPQQSNNTSKSTLTGTGSKTTTPINDLRAAETAAKAQQEQQAYSAAVAKAVSSNLNTTPNYASKMQQENVVLGDKVSGSQPPLPVSSPVSKTQQQAVVLNDKAAGTYNTEYGVPIGPSKPIVTNDPNYWTSAYANEPSNGGNGGNGGGNAGNGGTGGNGTGTGGGGAGGGTSTGTNVTQQAIVPVLDPVSDKAYKDALAALADVNGKAPTYANSYEQQLTDLYNQITNRDPFSYDVNSDMLYRQYAQMYANNGRLAMADTMGQAAGLTGGYGSSYSQAVGQQQYDRYMQELNGVIPELYDRAYSHWQDEGDQLLNQYGMIADRADDEYQKYLDAYSQWADQRDFAAQQANNEYDKYQNDLANYEKQLAAQQAAAAKSGGSSGSGKGGSTKTTNNPGYTADQIKALQQAAGLPVTGQWDANTEKAYNNGYRADGANVTDNVAVPSFKTYSEAVAYMNSNGVNNGNASGIMTESEWNRRKKAGSASASTSNYANYQDYLKDIVQYNIENK